jgi:hypothetical protein
MGRNPFEIDGKLIHRHLAAQLGLATPPKAAQKGAPADSPPVGAVGVRCPYPRAILIAPPRLTLVQDPGVQAGQAGLTVLFVGEDRGAGASTLQNRGVQSRFFDRRRPRQAPLLAAATDRAHHGPTVSGRRSPPPVRLLPRRRPRVNAEQRRNGGLVAAAVARRL